MRYNYVIFGSENELYKASYADLYGKSNAKYLWRRIDSENTLITFLYRLHTSPKSNKLFNLPGKFYWNKWAFRGIFDNDLPLCFIFFTKVKFINNGLPEYLKRTYKNCKTILFFQDLVERSPWVDVYDMKKRFDLVLSFDHGDVRKYDLLYYPLVYSPIPIPNNSEISESDVFFLGKGKNRLYDILQAFKKFNSVGLKCDFHIVDVKYEDMKYVDQISYNKPLSYIENLQRIQKTKCMLEIMQKNGTGYTLRCCEAIMYDKKMITNNLEIRNAPFYKKENIQIFEDTNSIDTNFIQNGQYNLEDKFKKGLSPLKLLEFLEIKL